MNIRSNKPRTKVQFSQVLPGYVFQAAEADPIEGPEVFLRLLSNEKFSPYNAASLEDGRQVAFTETDEIFILSDAQLHLNDKE